MECSGRTQRRLSVRSEAAPQRMDFGQGKLLTIAGRISASTSIVSRAGALDDGEIEFGALLVLVDPRLIERGETGAFEKALDRRLRRADARTFALLAHIGLAARQAHHLKREPARRGDRRRPLHRSGPGRQGRW